MHRFGHTERAAIGYTAGGFIGVHAVDFYMRGLQIIGTGSNTEQSRRELRGIGGGVEGAVIGDGFYSQGLHRAVALGCQLRADMVVSSKAVGLNVLRPILNPFDGMPGLDRRHAGNDIPGVNRHLAAEAAAYVRRDDVNLILRDAGDQ